jgi:hypothetical protein
VLQLSLRPYYLRFVRHIRWLHHDAVPDRYFRNRPATSGETGDAGGMTADGNGRKNGEQ